MDFFDIKSLIFNNELLRAGECYNSYDNIIQ